MCVISAMCAVRVEGRSVRASVTGLVEQVDRVGLGLQSGLGLTFGLRLGSGPGVEFVAESGLGLGLGLGQPQC